MWILYELLVIFGLLLYLPGACWRRRLPHAGWTMRLGRYPDAVRERVGARRTLWVHAVSVGEVLAAQPLVRALRQAYPESPIVLSTITPGGFSVATKSLGQQVIPVYFPLDLRGCVRRALDAFSPRILLLMESELWPMVIRETAARGIPLAVVNGRISSKALRRYRRAGRLLSGTFGRMDRFLMQRDEDAQRILQLGVPAPKVRVVGSLKWDASLGTRPALETLKAIADRLELNGHEPIIVAGSTHRGEEEAVLRALQTLLASGRTVRLILAPRHLERLAEVEALVTSYGLTSMRLSAAGPAPPWQVGLVDTFGQLPLYYGLATAVFVGGSLIAHGGQNPLEPASQGKPVLFGPSMQNFSEIAAQLTAHQAARQLTGGDELTAALQDVLARPEEACAMGQRARALTERCAGATVRTLEALRPLL